MHYTNLLTYLLTYRWWTKLVVLGSNEVVLWKFLNRKLFFLIKPTETKTTASDGLFDKINMPVCYGWHAGALWAPIRPTLVVHSYWTNMLLQIVSGQNVTQLDGIIMIQSQWQSKQTQNHCLLKSTKRTEFLRVKTVTALEASETDCKQQSTKLLQINWSRHITLWVDTLEVNVGSKQDLVRRDTVHQPSIASAHQLLSAQPFEHSM